MQWVSKAVQYYKDINPATLTGAIDVIVVERPTEDGTGSTELACSPFHVRFGKLSILRPIDKKVRITVNDEEIPFYMKVGETGEAFFVFETDSDVPEDLQTSPIAGPVQDVELDEALNGSPGEPEFLDLAAGPDEADEDDGTYSRRFSEDSSPNSSRYTSVNQTQLNSPTNTIKSLPGFSSIIRSDSASSLHKNSITTNDNGAFGDDEMPNSPSQKARPVAATVLGTAERGAAIGKMALTSLASGLGNKKLVDIHSNELNSRRASEEIPSGSALELGELEEGMRRDLEGLHVSHEEERKNSNSVGEEVREAAREKNSDLRDILGPAGSHDQHLGEDGRSTYLKNPAQSSGENGYFGSLSEVGHAPEQSGDLMLDMSGYKIGLEDAGDQANPSVEGDAELTEFNGPIDEAAEREMVAFTQGLLLSIDPKTLRTFFDPSETSETDSSSGSSPIPTPVGESLEQTTLRPNGTRLRVTSDVGRQRPTSISSLQSLHAEADKEPSPNDGVFQASPTQFSLRVGGKIHVFELSLCGGDAFGNDRARDERAFARGQLTFTQFLENDDITNESKLVVKYADRFLTWDNASPVLASLVIYRKSLVDHPEHHRQVDQAEVEGASKRTSRGWSTWWSRKDVTAGSTLSLPTKDTSPPTSPAVTRPPSPSSLLLPASPGLGPASPVATPDKGPEKDIRHYAKTLRLTSDQLKTLGLKKGKNIISFSVRSSYSGYATCTSRIFLWESDFQVVISDIDGTITKSDALGHVFTMIGRDWTHLGVAKLYTDIARNGYKMMYLTSRAIGQADTTREYLKGIKQNGFQLPEGPVIMSPDRLMTSLHREVVLRKPEVFKMACLRDIHRLFNGHTPFYAGFGNRITDALSYRSVEIPSSKIFTIDTNGEVKMELLELAGYKSSYIHMTDLVDQMFPPINRKTAPDFTDFNFWRAPAAVFEFPDLSPPSPALSARSDSSSRLPSFPRLNSIASSLSRRSSRSALTGSEITAPPSRTARGTTPSSPLLQATVVEEALGEDDEDDRSESESMPGSLPNGSDFERLRAAALRNGRKDGVTEAEAYKSAVRRAEENSSEEEEEDSDDDRDDEFGDQLDFSSVPY